VNELEKRLRDFLPKWLLFFSMHKHQYFQCNELNASRNVAPLFLH